MPNHLMPFLRKSFLSGGWIAWIPDHYKEKFDDFQSPDEIWSIAYVQQDGTPCSHLLSAIFDLLSEASTYGNDELLGAIALALAEQYVELSIDLQDYPIIMGFLHEVR